LLLWNCPFFSKTGIFFIGTNPVLEISIPSHPNFQTPSTPNQKKAGKQPCFLPKRLDAYCCGV
jgi:hypothetical protein